MILQIKLFLYLFTLLKDLCESKIERHRFSLIATCVNLGVALGLVALVALVALGSGHAIMLKYLD